MRVKCSQQTYDAQKIVEFIFNVKTAVNYVKLEDGSRIVRPLTHGYVPVVGDYVLTAIDGSTHLIPRLIFKQTYEILPDDLVVTETAEPAPIDGKSGPFKAPRRPRRNAS
jgi:hypothetical protein